MYQQIADDLQKRIEAGEWPAGAQLPTEPALMAQYAERFGKASRNTIRDAVRLLVSRRLVETRAGKGTFVVDTIDPFITTLSAAPTGFGGGEGTAYGSEVQAKQREPFVTKPRVEIQEATGKVAQELRIAEGAEVVSRHQERRIDGKPWSMQTSWYPMSFVERGATQLIGAQDIQPGVVSYLKVKLDIEQVGYQDLITVRTPHAEESAFFGITSDATVAIVETSRTAYDQHGQPLRLTVTVFPADRNQFIFNVGTLPPEIENPTGLTESG
jgi:GntR family transcriptional regulator